MVFQFCFLFFETIYQPHGQDNNAHKRDADHKQHHQKTKPHRNDLHACLFNNQKYAIDFEDFWIAFYLNCQNHSRAILLVWVYAVWRMEKS